MWRIKSLFFCILFYNFSLFAAVQIIINNETLNTFNVAANQKELALRFEQEATVIPPMKRSIVAWIDTTLPAKETKIIAQNPTNLLDIILTRDDSNLMLQQRINPAKKPMIEYAVQYTGLPMTWFSDRESHKISIPDKKLPLEIITSLTANFRDTILEYTIRQQKMSLAPPSSDKLALLSWNLGLCPASIIDFTLTKRAQSISDCIQHNYDVVFLYDVYDVAAREHLLSELKKDYPYQLVLNPRPEAITTKKITKQRHSSIKDRSGGIIMLSRWPIKQTKQYPFQNLCTGYDCQFPKGIMYAKIEKNDRHFHLFSAYLQAWPSQSAAQTRKQQLEVMQHFIADQSIPANEPIIVAGEFNINQYKTALVNETMSEYQNLLTTLNMQQPAQRGHRYTLDPSITNSLVRRIDPKEYTNYILLRNIDVKQSWSEVQIFKSSSVSDLSPYFAVEAHIQL